MGFPSGCFLRRGISQQFRHFGAPGAFFCLFCAGARRVFSPSSRFFIRNLLRFADATCRFLSAIPVFFGSRSIFFCRSCAGACRVFSPSFRFSSEIFHILRMLPAVFFPAIPALFPLFLPFLFMENLLLSCFRVDFSHESDARAFARA